jgi:transcriptional regulator with PAS, ATPase and Fis domain
MELSKYFKSVLEQDKSAVVICDLQHKIIYMNPAAKERYTKKGGENLLGKSLLDCHNAESGRLINKVIEWFAKSTDNNIVYTYHNDKENRDVYMVAMRDDDGTLIGYYEKHEYRNAETAKLYDID